MDPNKTHHTSQPLPTPVAVALLAKAQDATRSGVQWSHESDDLDMTLLTWERGKGIAPHVNTEVDVVWLGVAGTGTVIIDGAAHELRPQVALLIPKGCERSVESTSDRLTYLSLHKRRLGLQLTVRKRGG